MFSGLLGCGLTFGFSFGISFADLPRLPNSSIVRFGHRDGPTMRHFATFFRFGCAFATHFASVRTLVTTFQFALSDCTGVVDLSRSRPQRSSLVNRHDLGGDKSREQLSFFSTLLKSEDFYGSVMKGRFSDCRTTSCESRTGDNGATAAHSATRNHSRYSSKSC